MTKHPSMTFANAVLVQHCAVSGRLETRVRAYEVIPAPPQSVRVVVIEPRKRRRGAYTITADNLRYLTIEVADQVVYDSRGDVPCDMAAWATSQARLAERLARVGQASNRPRVADEGHGVTSLESK
jgi:hypothetical protein